MSAGSPYLFLQIVFMETDMDLAQVSRAPHFTIRANKNSKQEAQFVISKESDKEHISHKKVLTRHKIMNHF